MNAIIDLNLSLTKLASRFRLVRAASMASTVSNSVLKWPSTVGEPRRRAQSTDGVTLPKIKICCSEKPRGPDWTVAADTILAGDAAERLLDQWSSSNLMERWRQRCANEFC